MVEAPDFSCYGGMAINGAYYLYRNFYDRENELPDYDFFFKKCALQPICQRLPATRTPTAPQSSRLFLAGPGQEGNGHYCAYDLAPGTYLSDQRDTFVAQDNLRTMGAAYKSAGTPFFVGLGFHKCALVFGLLLSRG
jgi:hypothetical protein